MDVLEGNNLLTLTTARTDFLLYIVKCLIGVAIGFYLYRAYPQIGLWCLVSIVLVLSPDRKDAINLATSRIKANVIGAGIGLVLFFIHSPNLLMLIIGVVLTIVTCQLLKLQDVTRSACVSVVIILLHPEGTYFWDVALERAGGVVGGCIIAMLITWLFSVVMLKLRV